MPWARAIMKIQRQEPLLERMYAPIIGEWRDVAKRIEVLQRLVNDRQESVGVSSQKLVEMSEELSMAMSLRTFWATFLASLHPPMMIWG